MEVLVCPPSGQMRIAQNTKGALVKLTGESFRVTSTSSCSVKNEVGSIFEKKEVLQCNMIDDIKGEKRLRVEETTTSVYGLCYHAYENNISTDLNSADDCRSIRNYICLHLFKN